MSRLPIPLILGTLLVGACADDTPAMLLKGVVDSATLRDGVVVTLDGHIGTITVPFIASVPNVTPQDLEEELSGVVELTVDNASGTSFSIDEGTVVEAGAGPTGAGGYTWELNEARDAVTLRFFNETPSGPVLRPGQTYGATLSIASNNFVERVGTIRFDVAAN